MGFYAPYAVQLTGAGVIGGITRQNLDFAHEIAAEATAGSSYARIVMKRASRPMLTFTTKDIRAALGYIGTEGAKVKTGATITALNIFEVLLDECGKVVGTGTVHRRISTALACVFPRRLSVAVGQDAELECEAYLLSTDGIAVPMAVTTLASGSLPALPTSEERYTIGPCTFDGISIDNLTQLTIDFGLRPNAIMVDSAIAPKFVELPEILPTIEFTGHSTNLYADSSVIGYGGINGEHANSTFWLRKREAAGTGFVADTTAEHMKFTVDGLGVINSLSGDANRVKTISGSIRCKYDGTNTPIVLTAQDNIVDP